MTIIDAQNKVTQIALSQLGYTEQGKNITKYAQDFDTKYPNFYNTKKQGAEWCDIFNDWCFVEAFGEEIARKMLYQPEKSAGAGCKFSADYFKKNNAFYSSPKYADQIFFYVGGEINHTGRVIGISNTQVITVEGNAGNAVRQNIYSLTDKKIAGYGRPNWSLVANDKEIKTVTVEMPVLQLGSKCYEVGTLQIILNGKNFKGENGKPLTVDCDFGKNVRFAVHNVQVEMQKKGIIQKPDDICGQKTWNYLLKG